MLRPMASPAPRRRRILRQHLETDRLLGVDAVPVGSPAAQAAKAVEAPPSPVVRPTVRPADTTASQPAPPASWGPGTAPVAAEPAPAIASTKRGWGNGAGKAHAKREDKLAILQEMDEQEVRPCRKCGLCESRTQTVFGVGNPDAALMFIGEAPGETEDQRGEPFVGKAGELLNKMIVAMGLKRESVYIANVVKCRPPENRTPTPDETQACWDYLARQIEVVQPRVIVTLGGPATKTLLRTTTGITALRGQWHSYRPQGELADGMLKGRVYPVMPTFHPAYVLRNYSPDTRQKVWSDLQQVMAKLAEPE